MKVQLLRIGSLAAIAALGCIALARGQRGDEFPSEAAGTVARSSENPLREPAPAMVDPFASPLRRPEPPKTIQTAAEQPVSGPALGPINPVRPSDDRYADRTSREEVGSRYAVKGSEEHEPAPLKIDPFASPASPIRGAGPREAAVEPTVESEGTGQPGDRQLEGVQSPQLTIQKLAPQEVQVGRAASFHITVRNVGQTVAGSVEVRDMVPKGARLLGTKPQASRGARGEVVWTLGTIRPGQQFTVEMQLMPMVEGEIGSVATVQFGADASARTTATRPQLVVETVGPERVLLGDKATLTITVSNTGTGVASGVILDERLPPGLRHPAGNELEYEVGDLKPGESRKLELPLLAQKPGRAVNLLRARGQGGLTAESRLDIDVLAPQLDVALEGPKRRYLERQATYQLSVSNPGTAPAKQVELAAHLPAGLKFISANNAGHYDEATRTVRWQLEELPANETGSVTLVTMPVEAGQHAIRLRGSAQKGLNVEKEQPVLIEGIAAILFQVADTVDPIEMGGETIYEVRVMNQGSKAASNVRLAVVLPPEVRALAAEGPTRHAVDGDRVLFDALALLPPKADVAYRVRAKALRAGDLRVRFQLMTDDMQSPVTKEESTRVFADE